MNLREQIQNFPEEPGVYLFYNPRGEVLYVGKSKSLKSRVKSYLNPSSDPRPLIQNLAQEAKGVEFIVTDTEKEALILENNLISRHKPPYNVIFRDDSSYLMLKIDTSHPFPRVMITRRAQKDGALYFGPYTSGGALKETLQVIKKHFQIRTCTDTEFKRRNRPCLLYQIHRCGAPCTEKQSQREYEKIISQVILFLKGKDQSLLSSLEARMEEASGKLNFEEAARYRDKISALRQTVEKQKIVSMDQKDRDIFILIVSEGSVVVQALFIRSGKLISSHAQLMDSDRPAPEILSAYLKQYYCREVYLPDEILVGEDFEDSRVLSELISEKKGKKVPFFVPQKGKKKELIELARKNGTLNLKSLKKKRQFNLNLLSQLQQALSLSQIPQRMECFDISNIQGAYAVGAMSVYEMGEAAKKEYRKYKIRTVSGPDDFSMMEEVLFRRFRKGVLEGELPDLVVIDGGKGQLGVAKKILNKLGVQGVDLISLAKGRNNREMPERVFLSQGEEPVIFAESDPVFHLLQRLRDEAHRFAVSYHRTLRKNEILKKGKK